MEPRSEPKAWRESKISDAVWRNGAIVIHQSDGEIEFDLGCRVSRHDDRDGAYVQAWVWVPRAALGETK